MKTFIALFLAALLVGCGTPSSSSSSNDWVDDGQGIWHIKCTAVEFPASIVAFKNKHPDLKVAAIAHTETTHSIAIGVISTELK